MKLAVLARKGGTGKTTTAVHLATCAAETGRTYLLDVDGQQTAHAWADIAEEAGDPLRFDVLKADTPDVAVMVNGLPDDTAHVVFDTPPGDLHLLHATLPLADLVVMPFTPSPTDIAMLPDTVALTVRHHVPAVILLTQTERRGRDTPEVVDALEAADLPVLEPTVRRLADVRRSFGTRPRAHKSLTDYAVVWRDLLAIAADLEGANR